MAMATFLFLFSKAQGSIRFGFLLCLFQLLQQILLGPQGRLSQVNSHPPQKRENKSSKRGALQRRVFGRELGVPRASSLSFGSFPPVLGFDVRQKAF